MSVFFSIAGFLAFPILFLWVPHKRFAHGPVPLESLGSSVAFSEDERGYKKHILIGDCTTIYGEIGNTHEGKLGEVYNHDVTLASIMNALLASKDVRFYDFGYPAASLVQQLNYLLYSLNLTHLETIIYSSANPSPILNEDNPSVLSQYEQVLLELRKTSPKDGLGFDPLIGLVRERKRLADAHRLKVEKIDTLKWASEYFWKFTEFFRPGLSIIDYAFGFELSEGIYKENFKNTLAESLQQVRVTASKKEAGVPVAEIEAPEILYQFQGKEGQMRLDVIEAIALVAQKKGIRFIYYFPPMLGISAERYRKTYYPEVVKKVSSIGLRLGFSVVDHTIRHNLDRFDFPVRLTLTEPKKDGVVPNVVGNFKRAVLLLNELKIAGVLHQADLLDPNLVWKRSSTTVPVGLSERGIVN